jgi:subtilisin family serine protease
MADKEQQREACDDTTTEASPEPLYTGSKCGKGLYYLWHLQMIGMLHESDPKPEELGGADARVAIIDNGCVRSHPNLGEDRIVDRADFASDWSGVSYMNWDDPTAIAIDLKDLGVTTKELKKIDTVVGAFGNEAPFEFVPTLSAKDRLGASIKNVADGWSPKLSQVQDPSERFSNHGTSCSGLVAGGKSDGKNPWAIDYYGVNPKAAIIPINTPYNHEYVPLTLGLLHAYHKEADVILIPRGADDRETLANGGPAGLSSATRDPRFTRIDHRAELILDKLLFELVLAKVSAKIPVVVAAGNDGSSTLQYPARLVVAGKCPNLIVVGACNARGHKSSYSSGGTETSDRGVTVFAPSDDAEEISKDYFRYNETWWRGRQLPLDVGLDQTNSYGKPAETDNRFSPYGILAIDIPGTFSDASGSHEDQTEHNDPTGPESGAFSKGATEPDHTEHRPGSLYSVFGGTSAAAAIVAGVVSCIQGKKKESGIKTLSGTQMKAKILNAKKKSRPVDDIYSAAPDELWVDLIDWEKAKLL